MVTIGSLTIYEIGLIIFFVLFLFVSAQTFFRHRRERHEELEQFREQQRLEVIATEARKKFVKLQLNSQILTNEGAPSSQLNLNDDESDDSSHSQDNIFTRTLCSAGKSFRELLGSSVSKRECSICLAEFQPKETVSWAKRKECSHVFHQDCIIQWLEKHDECPLCRIDIIEGVDDCEDPVISTSNESDDDDAEEENEQIEASTSTLADESQVIPSVNEDLDQIPL